MFGLFTLYIKRYFENQQGDMKVLNEHSWYSDNFIKIITQVESMWDGRLP